MGLFALSLILIAAVLHATWNLLVKRAGAGDLFAWLYGGVAAVLYLPVSVPLIVRDWPAYDARHAIGFAGSGLLNMLYFLVLQRAYRAGDLSVIYPLARGTGPVLSTLAAIWLLHERPSWLALAGAVGVIASVVIFATSGRSGNRANSAKTANSTNSTNTANSTNIAGHASGAPSPPAARGLSGAALAFGVATGVIIATYTVWDKQVVSTLRVSPWLLPWATSLALTMALAPAAVGRWDEVRRMWRDHWRAAIGVGAMYPLAYILVLLAMRVSPVSYVAPAREVSILFGALMGARLLGEGQLRRRLAAASVMLAGLAALAWG
jgi:drug/metabolite transporter (DMT)-like permease